MGIGKIGGKRMAVIKHSPAQNRPPEALIRDLQKLETHPKIGGHLVDLVAVSMNLAVNTREHPIDVRNRIVASDVSTGVIHAHLETVNRMIERMNLGLPENERIRPISVEEVFNLIHSRWKNG